MLYLKLKMIEILHDEIIKSIYYREIVEMKNGNVIVVIFFVSKKPFDVVGHAVIAKKVRTKFNIYFFIQMYDSNEHS